MPTGSCTYPTGARLEAAPAPSAARRGMRGRCRGRGRWTLTSRVQQWPQPWASGWCGWRRGPSGWAPAAADLGRVGGEGGGLPGPGLAPALHRRGRCRPAPAAALGEMEGCATLWGRAAERGGERERSFRVVLGRAPDVKTKFSLSSTGCNRSAVSYSLISPNQSVFWQIAQNGVSASKRPSLWMSARQLSVRKNIKNPIKC